MLYIIPLYILLHMPILTYTWNIFCTFTSLNFPQTYKDPQSNNYILEKYKSNEKMEATRVTYQKKKKRRKIAGHVIPFRRVRTVGGNEQHEYLIMQIRLKSRPKQRPWGVIESRLTTGIPRVPWIVARCSIKPINSYPPTPVLSFNVPFNAFSWSVI